MVSQGFVIVLRDDVEKFVFLRLILSYTIRKYIVIIGLFIKDLDLSLISTMSDHCGPIMTFIIHIQVYYKESKCKY